MNRYAERTTVSSEQSRGEIERILVRYRADQFMYGWDAGSAVLAFRAKGRMIRFVLPMPDRTSREFTHTPSKGQLRPREVADQVYDQAVRQRWRALALAIKAKLEAVEAGITEFEAEFLAHIVLPDGQTVGDWIAPQIESSYRTGHMPPLLPGPST